MENEDQDDKFLKTLSKNPELLNELDKVSPGLKNQIHGYVLSKWLPDGIVRKVCMLILFLLGLYGLLIGSHWFILCFILVPMFSPRAVGEIAIFLGRAKGR